MENNCSVCGERLNEGAFFCKKCGARVKTVNNFSPFAVPEQTSAPQANSIPPSPPVPTGKKRHNSGAIAAITAGVLVIIIAGIALIVIAPRKLTNKAVSPPIADTTDNQPSAAKTVIQTEATPATATDSVTSTLYATAPATSPDATARVIYSPVDFFCSDNLAASANRTFYARNVADEDFDTCWLANAGTAGAGAWLELDYGKQITVSGVRICNGNIYINPAVAPEDNAFHIYNGQVKRFRLVFSDGSSEVFTATYNSDRVRDFEYFYFDARNTSSIRIEVISGYSGSLEKYRNNVALTALEAFCGGGITTNGY